MVASTTGLKPGVNEKTFGANLFRPFEKVREYSSPHMAIA
jgi:hypothetical protein